MENGTDSTRSIRCDALVDTGAACQPVKKAPLHSTGAASRLNCVVRRLRMPNMRPPHALSAGRPARLGAPRGSTTGCYLTLPSSWRERLGKLRLLDTVSVETATQAVVSGDICGPVLLRMGQFRPVLTEALFIDMEPSDGQYAPLIGYIPLEQAQAVVDRVGHRLVKFSRVDLKQLDRDGGGVRRS